MAVKRLFISVEIPKKVQNVLGEICAFFKKKDLFVGRCTASQNLHVTLKFLGDIDEAILQNIDAQLRSISFQACEATLSQLDLLPSCQKIRILFVHLVCPQLSLLASEIEHCLSNYVKKENRTFKNHITLARIKSVPDTQKLLKVIDTFEVPDISFRVGEFFLRASELNQTGPIYTTIFRYSLL